MEDKKQVILNQLEKRRIGRSTGEGVGGIIGLVIGSLLIASGQVPLGLGFLMASFTIGAAIGGLIDPPKAPDFGDIGSMGSPTYSFGALKHTITNQLPVAIIYGEVKVAGNVIWQSEPGVTIDRIQVLCNGEINSIGTVKVNDIAIGDLSGCSSTAYTGTTTQTVDSRATGKVAGLKRTAYLAYTLATGDQLKGGNPVVTCVVEGLKIRTWNSTTNVWNGTKAYSNNPSACIRDFLTNDIYGLGIPESWIDDTSFGSVSEYCDTDIDDGASGTENRFELDIAIDARRPALDILNDMLATFGGFLSVTGEKIKLEVEKGAGVAAQAFDMDNIISGSFGYSKFSKDDLPNRVMVQYVDPEKEWVKIYAMAEDKVDQDKREALALGRNIVEKRVSLLGITRFSQASRMARRYLYLAAYCSTLCSFKVGVDSIFCEPGDIIAVTHDVSGWSSKMFRILSMEEDEKDTISIACREYNASIYDDNFGSVIETIDDPPIANEFEPVTDVSSLTAIEDGYTDEDGTYVAEIDVGWTAPTDITRELLDSYIIELKKGAGAYIEVGRADGDATAYTIRPVEGGITYYVKVKTVSITNIVSTGTTSGAVAVAGQSTNPGTVGTFTNTFTDEIVFNWAANSERDVINYEIRIADSNWGVKNNDFIWIGDATTYTVVRPTARSGITYYIKAKNRSALYSTNAASTAPTNAAPAAPTLSATSWFGFATLNWTDTNDADLLHYETWRSDTNAWAGEESLDMKVRGTQAKIYGNAPVSISGTAAGATTLQDTGIADTIDDQFNGDVITQVDGTEFGQTATVTDFASGTQTFTVDAWSSNTPDAGDRFICKDRAYFKVGGVDTFGSGTLSSYEQIDFNPLTMDEIDAVGNITQTEIRDGSIVTPKLAANAVTAAKVTTGELITLSAQIKNGTITNANIYEATIQSAKISGLVADKITAGTYIGGNFIIGDGGNIRSQNYQADVSGVLITDNTIELNQGSIQGEGILETIMIYAMVMGD